MNRISQFTSEVKRDFMKCHKLLSIFYEREFTDILQAEAQRREVEVRKLGEDLVEIRRKNRVIQDKVKEQIDVLQRKLEEYKIEHKAQEESLEDEIVAKEDLITSVKQSIEFRMKGIQLDTSETKLSEEERYKRNTGCPKSKLLNNFGLRDPVFTFL